MKNWSICSFLFISILISLISCKYSKEPQMNNKTQDEILYRPNFHFSPRNNWMNDPNGMFFYKGNYYSSEKLLENVSLHPQDYVPFHTLPISDLTNLVGAEKLKEAFQITAQI